MSAVEEIFPDTRRGSTDQHSASRINCDEQTRRDQRAVDHAKLQPLRDFVHEMCGFIILNAEAVQIAAEQGDDVSLGYSLRRLVLHAKAAAKSANEVRSIHVERSGGAE